LLVILITDDEHNTIEAIYDKHGKRMIYVASKILGGVKGEDAMHDAFVKLLENFSELSKAPCKVYPL